MSDNNKKVSLNHLNDDSLPVVSKSRVVHKGSLGKDFFTSNTATKEGKSIGSVQRNLYQLQFKESEPKREVSMKTVDIECRYAKGRAELFNNGEIILHFDEKGFAKLPAHQLELFRRIQAARPGRFRVVQDSVDTQEVPAVEVPVKKEEPKKQLSTAEVKSAKETKTKVSGLFKRNKQTKK